MSVLRSPGKYPVLVSTLLLALLILAPTALLASEANITLPDLYDKEVVFNLFGTAVKGTHLLMVGLVICIAGGLFGVFQSTLIKKLPAHKSMLEVSELIYSTCKTYLMTQGKLLAILELLIGAVIFVYFAFLVKNHDGRAMLKLRGSRIVCTIRSVLG